MFHKERLNFFFLPWFTSEVTIYFTFIISESSDNLNTAEITFIAAGTTAGVVAITWLAAATIHAIKGRDVLHRRIYPAEDSDSSSDEEDDLHVIDLDATILEFETETDA